MVRSVRGKPQKPGKSLATLMTSCCSGLIRRIGRSRTTLTAWHADAAALSGHGKARTATLKSDPAVGRSFPLISVCVGKGRRPCRSAACSATAGAAPAGSPGGSVLSRRQAEAMTPRLIFAFEGSEKGSVRSHAAHWSRVFYTRIH